MSSLDPSTRFNIAKASVLVVDGSEASLETTRQIFRGFGAQKIYCYANTEGAQAECSRNSIDLVVMDPAVESGAGYDLVRAIRRGETASKYAPILLTLGYVRLCDINRARDCGANFMLTKPVSPEALLKRILWAARSARAFIETEAYVGPDRRFKFEGPPPGIDGRRATDVTTPLSDAEAPNLSQQEVEAMIRPQRVVL
ncbi:MAG: response regulator [Hyphomonadaceae bacterium]